MSTRKSTEDRQIELTEAALHIIAVEGIAALNTRKLAAEVGLSSGAIFRHFPSLDALLEGVVLRIETVLDATYPPAELPPAERLVRFVEARCSVVSQQTDILTLVLSEQFRLALSPNGSERLRACVENTRVFLEECLREGQRCGQFRSDVDADALALIVMGSIQMLALSGGSADATEVREGLIALLRNDNNQESSP